MVKVEESSFTFTKLPFIEAISFLIRAALQKT